MVYIYFFVYDKESQVQLNSLASNSKDNQPLKSQKLTLSTSTTTANRTQLAKPNAPPPPPPSMTISSPNIPSPPPPSLPQQFANPSVSQIPPPPPPPPSNLSQQIITPSLENKNKKNSEKPIPKKPANFLDEIKNLNGIEGLKKIPKKKIVQKKATKIHGIMSSMNNNLNDIMAKQRKFMSKKTYL